MKTEEITNKEKWENFLSHIDEKTFLNSWNWGEFQLKMGDKIWRLGIFDGGDLVAIALVVRVKAKRGTFLFVPHGPTMLCIAGNPKSEIRNPKQIQNSKSQILNTFLNELKNIAKKEGASFIRIAPILERNGENEKIFRELGFRTAPMHMHPEVTWELDITPSEDRLLAGMRKTTRYLIRQAVKNKDIEIIKLKRAEQRGENHGCGYAVCVVVAMNGYFFVLFHCAKEPVCGLFHVLKQKRIMNIFGIIRIEKFINFFLRSNVSVIQQMRDSFGKFRVLIKK